MAGNLLEAIRDGTDLLLYRPAVDWISHFARAGASLSRRAHWAAAKEIEIHLEEVDAQSTLIEIRVDSDVRRAYTTGAAVTGLLLGSGTAFGVVGLAGYPARAPSGAGFVSRRSIGGRCCDGHCEDHGSLRPKSPRGGSARTRGGARSVGAR